MKQRWGCALSCFVHKPSQEIHTVLSCTNFELNEVFKSLDTIYKQFVFHTEKLKDTTHGLSQLSRSSRYLEIQWFTCEHNAIMYSQGYTTGVVGYSDELPLQCVLFWMKCWQLISPCNLSAAGLHIPQGHTNTLFSDRVVQGRTYFGLLGRGIFHIPYNWFLIA